MCKLGSADKKGETINLMKLNQYQNLQPGK